MAAKKKKKQAPKRSKGNVAKARKFKATAAKRRAKIVTKKPVKKAAAPAAKASPKQNKKQQDQDKKAEGLMASGRQRGFVTYDEILKSFPTIETDVEFLEELYDKFSTAKIDVLDVIRNGLIQVPLARTRPTILSRCTCAR